MSRTFKVVKVDCAPGHRGSVFNFLNSSTAKGNELPPSLPTLRNSSSTLNLANMLQFDLAMNNGPLPPAPLRASPAPQGPPVPNGKPTSPYNEQRNPMSPNAQIAAQTVSSKDPKAAAQAASDMRNVVRRKLTGYVGFANLPNQWHRKSVRKGFNFNVMVVGKVSRVCSKGSISNSSR